MQLQRGKEGTQEQEGGIQGRNKAGKKAGRLAQVTHIP